MLYHYSFRGYAADGMSTMPYPLLAPVAKYGYLGVQLFFLISGFVILMTASTGSLKKFIVSRFARLYPAFWVCCTVTFVTIATIGGKYYSASISQYFINMTMLSGFIGVPSIDGSYWSIFIELKFYALIALLLIFRKINQAQLFLVLWLIATIALNVLKIGKLGSLLSIILIVDYSPYFIAGAMSFLVWSRGISLTRISVIFIAWLLAISYSLDEIPKRETHYNREFNSYVVIGMISTFFAINVMGINTGSEDYQGVKLFDRSFNFLRQLALSGGTHTDNCFDSSESEVILHQDENSSAIVSVQFSTGKETTILPASKLNYSIHISCQNIRRPGWAYISEFAGNPVVKKANYNEVFAVKLDGSGTVQCFAHEHHSLNEAYERNPMGVPNHDGSKVLFASDLDNQSDPVYAYIAEFR